MPFPLISLDPKVSFCAINITSKRRKLTEPETYLEKRFMSYLLGTQASKRFPFQTTAFFRLNRKLSTIKEFCY